jgi:hypothetical protein
VAKTIKVAMKIGLLRNIVQEKAQEIKRRRNVAIWILTISIMIVEIKILIMMIKMAKHLVSVKKENHKHMNLKIKIETILLSYFEGPPKKSRGRPKGAKMSEDAREERATKMKTKKMQKVRSSKPINELHKTSGHAYYDIQLHDKNA